MRKLKISQEQINEIIVLYQNGTTGTELLKKFDISCNALYALLRKNHVTIKSASLSHRKYTINENYFDKINSEEKAYFIGFIMADGSNSVKKRCVRIRLAEIDKEILIKFKKILNMNGKLNYFPSDKMKLKNCQNAFELAIYNKYISIQLEKLGVVENKTENLLFPTYLNNSLLPHFLRGYFDGDGSIIWQQKFKKAGICICATLLFNEYLRNLIAEKLKITSHIVKRHKNSESNNTQLIISGNQQIKKFINWIYPPEHSISLKRKCEKINLIRNKIK